MPYHETGDRRAVPASASLKPFKRDAFPGRFRLPSHASADALGMTFAGVIDEPCSGSSPPDETLFLDLWTLLL